MIKGFAARRMKSIPFSEIRQVFEQVDRMKARGQKVIPFHIGQPDFDTPAHIKEAAKLALDRGLTAYTSNYGLPALRQAIAAKLAVDNGITTDPDTQIIVTAGSNEALFIAMMATLNPGDEVLIPDPSWLHYFYCARLAGARPVSVPLRMENGFQLDLDDLERLVTRRTRMVVINSPHNPTGAVFRKETLEGIARFVERHNLLLVSDEIYEKMIFNSQPHFSAGAQESIRERTITVNGFSKAYAMTGWRVGYLTASPSLVGAMLRVHQYTTICATSFAQAGALAALTGPQDSVVAMMAEFARRRQAVLAGLQPLEGLGLVPPQGAFYAFPATKASGVSSEIVARQLMEQAGVAVISGRAFGEHGEGFIRLSFACSLPEVQQGIQAIARYWEKSPVIQHV